MLSVLPRLNASGFVDTRWPFAVPLSAPCPGSCECPALMWPQHCPDGPRVWQRVPHTFSVRTVVVHPGPIGLRDPGHPCALLRPCCPASSLSPIWCDSLKAELVSELGRSEVDGRQETRYMQLARTWGRLFPEEVKNNFGGVWSHARKAEVLSAVTRVIA